MLNLFRMRSISIISQFTIICSFLCAALLEGAVIETYMVPNEVYFVYDQHQQSQHIIPFRGFHPKFNIILGDQSHKSFSTKSSYFILVQAKKINWLNLFKLRDKVVIKRTLKVFFNLIFT